MKRKKQVSQRTISLLVDIAEHRAAFPDLFRRRHFARVHASGVASWFQRRVDNEQLVAQKLYGKRKYYHLTEKAVRILRNAGFHVSRGVTRPLGPEAKRLYFALALYCNPESGEFKSVYRPAFDAELFPQLAARTAKTHSDPFRRKHFYRDGDLVGYFVVDRGQEKFIAKKVQPKLSDLLCNPKYTELVRLARSSRFRLTVVTATEQRGKELRTELNELKPPFSDEVVVYPELIPLLPKQRSTSPSLF